MAEEYELRLVQHRSKRIKKQNSSFMSQVKDDLLTEILLRLPHRRSAIQTSLVCKKWGSIINSDHFVKRFSQPHHESRYLDPSYALPFTLLFGDCRKISNAFASYELSSEIDLDFLPVTWSGIAYMVISAGDLLLLNKPNNHTKDFCLCNPITTEWNILPVADNVTQWYFDASGMWLDPNRTGPGSKPLGNYSVVVLSRYFHRIAYGCWFRTAIFSSETGQWNERLFTAAKPSTALEFMPCFDHAVTCGGVLYFPRMANWSDRLAGFLAVDPAAIRGGSWFVELPSCFGHGWRARRSRVFTGVVRGRLRISQKVKTKRTMKKKSNRDAMNLKVWELCDDRESWVLVHNVSFQNHDEIQRSSDMISVVAFHPNNGDVVFVMLGDYVCRYNVIEGKYEKLGRVTDFNCRSTRVFSLVHASLSL